MYSQLSSSSYSSPSNSNSPPTPAVPMYPDIPQPFHQGFANPAQSFDMGMMGYQNNMMMMPNQPFVPEGMMQGNNGVEYYDQQLQGRYPIDYPMMPQQQMAAGTIHTFQPGYHQDVFQPIPQQIPIDQHNFGYMDNTQVPEPPVFYNGFENLPPAPVNNYEFITDQPAASRRKYTKSKVPKVSTMHLNTACSNCGTRETKLWRRNEKGEPECNPCNLYERFKGSKRPANLWNKPTIKRKRRAPVAPVVQDDNDDME